MDGSIGCHGHERGWCPGRHNRHCLALERPGAVSLLSVVSHLLCLVELVWSVLDVYRSLQTPVPVSSRWLHTITVPHTLSYTRCRTRHYSPRTRPAPLRHTQRDKNASHLFPAVLPCLLLHGPYRRCPRVGHMACLLPDGTHLNLSPTRFASPRTTRVALRCGRQTTRTIR